MLDAATSPLLMISGSGAPDWIWDDVRGMLPADRLTAVAARPDSAGRRSLDDYAAAALSSAPWQRFVVVAHSIGGVIATRMIEQAPERVIGVIGVAAAFPEAGKSFFGALPFPQRAIVGGLTRILGTRPPAKMLRTGLAHGVDEATTARLIADFAPESQALFRTAVGRVEFPSARGYLRTSDDPEMPLALQDRSVAVLGATHTETLAEGHLPMLTNPTETAACLERLLSHG